MRFISLIFLYLCASSICAQNKDIINKFGKTTEFGIGVIRLLPAEFYSSTNDKSLFLSIKVNMTDEEYILQFSPENYKEIFNPLYFYTNRDFYNIFDVTFRVISRADGWMQIVFDEEAGRTCYVKSTGVDGIDLFQTWEDYLKGSEWKWENDGQRVSTSRQMLLLSLKDQPIYDEINGNIIHKNISRDFYAKDVKGEWAYIVSFMYVGDTEELQGWIRWRNDDKILIHISETWGLE